MPAFFWSCGAYSETGARRSNEDNYYLDGSWMPQGGESPPRARGKGWRQNGVLAVFDGLGGERAGEYASFTAAHLMDGYREALHSPGEKPAERYIHAVNAQLLARGEELGGTVGATMALLALGGGEARAANLGDSRIYLLRGGQLSRLSRDHTLANLLVERGDLSREQARLDPRRNSLLRHLGSREGERGLRPSRARLRLEPGDRFLLCSDGVSGPLPEPELVRLLRGARSAAAAAERLVRAALEAGGRDNATALCAFIDVRLF